MGKAALKQTKDTEVYLQLAPGDSIIVRTLTKQSGSSAHAASWNYTSNNVLTTQPITGTWHVDFKDGGPTLPHSFDTNTLVSWANRDEATRSFAGTSVYTVHFNFNGSRSSHWILNLGEVLDSARVTLNNHPVSTLWAAPFKTAVSSYLKQGDNVLIIEVTNVAANRIADLDRKKVAWKSFYEINFVNRAYTPFDASTWPLRDAGLKGPVSLTETAPFTPSH